MKLLLHICCAVCILAPIKKLKENGYDVTGYFFNPNIHPFLEFRRRIKALRVFQESEPVKIIYTQEYGLKDYLEKVNFRSSNRCNDCYYIRLEETARFARENNFESFSSSLLFSLHQNHEQIKLSGFEIAEKFEIKFNYFDYRQLSTDSQTIASKKLIYKQSYCGCIFSEHERYKDSTKHLYKNEIVRDS